MANFLVVLISTCITAGLGAMLPSFEDSFVENYNATNVPDIIIKSKSNNGLSEDEIDKIQSLFSNASYETLMSFDLEQEETYERIYALSLDASTLARPDLVEGSLPSNQEEILALRGTNSLTSYAVGDKVTFNLDSLTSGYLKEVEFTISGLVESPLYTSQAAEQAWVDSDIDIYISSIFYYDIEQIDTSNLVASILKTAMVVNTDLFVRFDIKHKYFTTDYKEKMETNKNLITASLGEENVNVLTMEENTSYALYRSYNNRVTAIALIIPVMFVVLCALVNAIIIMRLIKDERSLIATYSCLGIPKSKIVMKYTIFSLISVGVGALAGYFIGCPLLPAVILDAYGAVFRMHGLSVSFFTSIGIVILCIIIAAALLITIISTLRYLKETPASLMKEKAPKPGKKILLERIPLLWRPLRFSLKSSLRNIFRQKLNFFLASLAIIGSEILVFVGLCLHDVSDSLRSDILFGNIADSMGSISLLIIMLALAMAVTIVYALATMNIQDRVRELATLKVLGYYEAECSMYTFREILIESIFAVIIGLPIAVLVSAWALWYIDFGSIADVQWWTYVFSPLIIVATTCLTNLILFPRIRKIDMNSSLKSLD